METIERHQCLAEKADGISLAIVASLVSVVQAGVWIMCITFPRADSAAIEALWTEVHNLGAKIEDMGTNIAALQEDGKQDTRRDTAISELDKQVTAIGKAQAADEAILRAKGSEVDGRRPGMKAHFARYSQAYFVGPSS